MTAQTYPLAFGKAEKKRDAVGIKYQEGRATPARKAGSAQPVKSAVGYTVEGITGAANNSEQVPGRDGEVLHVASCYETPQCTRTALPLPFSSKAALHPGYTTSLSFMRNVK